VQWSTLKGVLTQGDKSAYMSSLTELLAVQSWSRLERQEKFDSACSNEFT